MFQMWKEIFVVARSSRAIESATGTPKRNRCFEMNKREKALRSSKPMTLEYWLKMQIVPRSSAHGCEVIENTRHLRLRRGAPARCFRYRSTFAPLLSKIAPNCSSKMAFSGSRPTYTSLTAVVQT